MNFFSITLAERTSAGVRQSVEQDLNQGHVFTTTSGLSGVIISDKEYPSRVAFSLLNKVKESIKLAS